MEDKEISLALRAAVVDGDEVESARLAKVASRQALTP